jgi:hypothetical protein
MPIGIQQDVRHSVCVFLVRVVRASRVCLYNDPIPPGISLFFLKKTNTQLYLTATYTRLAYTRARVDIEYNE